MQAVAHTQPIARAPLREAPATDEAAARRALRLQVARLETDLAELLLSTWPRPPVDCRVEGGGEPRLLTLDELERLRDRMAARVAAARRTLDERGRVQEDARRVREEMLLEPGRHAWARVTNEDVGEPGCVEWHVRPRFGLLGMLMRWWRVRISSGCP